jgi:hypothetical protein
LCPAFPYQHIKGLDCCAGFHLQLAGELLDIRCTVCHGALEVARHDGLGANPNIPTADASACAVSASNAGAAVRFSNCNISSLRARSRWSLPMT